MAAALFLRRDGHRVTIFERFDKAQPIGSGLLLQPTGLAVLHHLGLDQIAMERGQRIGRLRGEAGGRIVLDVGYSALRRGDLFGIGIDRAVLFDLLHAELEKLGITVVTGHDVKSADIRLGARFCFSNGASEGPFDILVDAMGTKSELTPNAGKWLAYGALWANVALPREFDAHTLAQRYRLASKMAGVLPVGSSGQTRRAAFFWSLRADDFQSWEEAGLDRWKAEVLDLWPATAAILDEIQSPRALTFARYAHKTFRPPTSDRLIHIGDAWHSASPQLGQGANMALLDAYALAAGIREGRDLPDGLARAVRMRRSHVHLYQLLTALLTPVYQSDSRWIPFVRDRLMGPASKLWPITAVQAALVAGLVGSPLRRLGIDFAPPHSAR